MDNYVRILAVISVLIFLLMIPMALLTGVHEFIPDLMIFIILTLFYYWTYDVFRMNMPIFTLLIIGHLLHGAGIFGWYHVSPIWIQWDHVTHFFGAFPYALLFFRWMQQWMDEKFFTRKNLLLLMAVFFAAMGVGAMVELSEFIGYLTLGFGNGAFKFGAGDSVVGASDLIDLVGGGWINEGWDFVFNTIGIIVGMGMMMVLRIVNKKKIKTVFLGTPHKLGDLNHQLIERIKKSGFKVFCAVTHSPQDAPFEKMFRTNIELIKKSDIFIAVLKDYGKDLTAEVGMVYAWGKPCIGIDFNAKKEDVMCYYALDYIIKPEQLEETLSKFK